MGATRHGGRSDRYKPGDRTPTNRVRSAPRWSDEARVGTQSAREAMEAEDISLASDVRMMEVLTDATRLSKFLRAIALHCVTTRAAEVATSVIMHHVEQLRRCSQMNRHKSGGRTTPQHTAVQMFSKLRKRGKGQRAVDRARATGLEEASAMLLQELLAGIISEEVSEIVPSAVRKLSQARQRDERKRQAEQGRAAVGVVAEAEGVLLHLSERSATGYAGVAFHPGSSSEKPYYARAGQLNGRKVNLGYYATAIEAALVIARYRSAHPEVAYKSASNPHLVTPDDESHGGPPGPMSVEATLVESDEEEVGDFLEATVEAVVPAPRDERRRQAEQYRAAVGVVTEAEGVLLHLSERSATGYAGVAFRPGQASKPYYARAGRVSGRNVNLGHFATAVEAALAIARYRAAHPEVVHQHQKSGRKSHPDDDSHGPMSVEVTLVKSDDEGDFVEVAAAAVDTMETVGAPARH